VTVDALINKKILWNFISIGCN